MTRAPLLAGPLLALVVLLHAAPDPALAAQGFSPEPVPGGITLTRYTGTLDTLAADGATFELESCFAAVNGELVGYVFGAPPFVNARFADAFAGGFDERGLICRRAPERTAPDGSLFAHAQVVSLYGYPGIPIMGILGAMPPAEAAAEVGRWAQRYAALGDRDVIPALHLITAVAQRSPGADGSYLYRVPDDVIAQYAEVTRDRGQLLFLDVQVGWSTPVAEARRLERWLREPHIHLAVDPEFATRPLGVAPGRAIGHVTGAQVNEVQAFLSDLARGHDLPHRILVVHQFRDDMIQAPGDIATYEYVDLVIDMDGFGPRATKLWGYQRYALSDYAAYAGFKLFFDWDTPLMSPEEIQAMDRPPDLVIYQ